MADISALQNNVESLKTIVTNIGPVLQANTDIVGKAVGIIEALLTALKQPAPSQADIDALTASTAATLAQLGADITQVNAANAALQDEVIRATTGL